tara:strand:- start:2333 stop:4096 length:1764 start_codon:yes stop_codon:yes gene_type:complete
MRKLILIIFFIFFSSIAFAQSDYSNFTKVKKLFNQKNYSELTNLNFNISSKSEFYPYYIFYRSISNYYLNNEDQSLNDLNEIIKSFPKWSQIDEVYYWIIKIIIGKESIETTLNYFNKIKNIQIQEDIYSMIEPEIKKISSFNQLKTLYKNYANNKIIAKYYGRSLLKEYLSDEIIDEITEILDLVERDELFVVENKKFRVAVLLPFMFDGFDNDNFIKNNNFIMDLYSGILFGHKNYDSINSMIDIIPFDTRRDPIVVRKIIQEGNLDNVDLIIGPLYGKPIEIIKQFCLENKILMINPLSSNNKIIDDNRYSLLFKPSIKTVAQKASEYSIDRFNTNKNTIIFYENNFQDSLIAKIYYDNLEKNGFNIIYSKSVSKDDSRLILDSLASTYEEMLSDSIYDTLKNISGILIKDGRGIDELDTAYKYIEKFYIEEDSIGHVFVSSKNSLFASNIISAVDIRNDTIPVLGFEDWLKFNLISINQFQDLDISLISPSFSNSLDEDYKYIEEYFIDNYRRKPSNNFIIGVELINMIIDINKSYGRYFQFGLRNEKLIKGKISGGSSYLRANDNQIVPVIKVVESDIIKIN